MHNFLKSIKSVMTIGGLALVILAVAMRVSGQTGQLAPAPGNKTQSSANKSGNAMPPHSKDVRCDPDPVAAGGKPQAALAGIAQPHRVDLTWKASSTPGVQYRVYRCIPGGPCVFHCAPGSPCPSIALLSGTSTSDTNVQVGQPYCYFITAVTAATTNKEQESDPSNVVTVLIRSPETPSPQTPSK